MNHRITVKRLYLDKQTGVRFKDDVVPAGVEVIAWKWQTLCTCGWEAHSWSWARWWDLEVSGLNREQWIEENGRPDGGALPVGQAHLREHGNWFPFPEPPSGKMGGTWSYMHEHVFTLVGAQRNLNETLSSLWTCEHCPDIRIGDYIGPKPPGLCRCGWVQKKWPRKKCEECKRPMEQP